MSEGVDKSENTVIKQNKPWQFQPGQSGNPKGKPKGSVNSFKSVLNTMLDRLDDADPEDKRTYREKIAEYVIKKAKMGELDFIKECINRSEGLPKQSIDQTITEIPPIEFVRKNED